MSRTFPTPTDGELVAAVLAGEKEQFATIVDRYRGPLLRVAYSRSGRAEWAEDIVQETFLCAFKWLSSYDSRYSFRTWLWTILLNQCNRHYQKSVRQPQVSAVSDRSNQREQAVSEGIDVRESPEHSPPARLLAKERVQLLERLLDALTDVESDALRLRFFGGLKFQEIADAMGCSLSSAKNRVRSGLEKLSQMMTEDDVAPVFLPDSMGPCGETQ